MPVVADILLHIAAASRRDINDERDLSFFWVQIVYLLRRDCKLNAASGDRAARGNLGGEVQLHWIGESIEGAPGEEGTLPHPKLVRGRDKGEPGADQVALRIIFQF